MFGINRKHFRPACLLLDRFGAGVEPQHMNGVFDGSSVGGFWWTAPTAGGLLWLVLTGRVWLRGWFLPPGLEEFRPA